MASVAENLTHQMEEKRQLYLQRVKKLFDDVKTWLPDDLIFNELPTQRGRPIQDETGEYPTPILTIREKNKPEWDSFIADLLLEGCSTLLSEGLVELIGSFSEESIIYLSNTGLVTYTIRGQQHPVLQGFDNDGWYWLESGRRNRVLQLNREVFVELLPIVSSYVPD